MTKFTPSILMLVTAASAWLQAAPGEDAVYTVEPGKAGFYALSDSLLHCAAGQKNGLGLKVQVRRADGTARQPEPAVETRLAAGEIFDFDSFLGYLAAGDEVRVSLDPKSAVQEFDYHIAPAPGIPVSAFPAEADRWVSFTLADQGPAARHLAWGDPARAARNQVTPNGEVATVRPTESAPLAVAFRVPQSGFYALHEAWARAASENGAPVEARVYAGRAAEASRIVKLAPGGERSSLETELGYLAKGEVVYLTFAGAGTVEFAAGLVEWAPRRAPLRVVRGADGLLDVLEPQAARTLVDIPAARWINVPTRDADATEAIKSAIESALALRKDGGGYVGIRLEAGKVYTVATGINVKEGKLFEFKDIERFVFDGNGATLLINSPELPRDDVQLFVATLSRKLVFADLIVEDKELPFAIGDIVKVGPLRDGNQEVLFKVPSGAADPIKDIRANGMAEGYAYDPEIPGRLAFGTWSHYPGGKDVNPQLKATAEPGVFSHTVTRTNGSIPTKGKWLVKNKRGGVIYLVAGAESEDITLSRVEGRAVGGGTLRFWGAPGVNILDCNFEPQGNQWISSTADGLHGRGSEGVWVENSLFRGICEDIMNTYGVGLLVMPDSDPDEHVVTLNSIKRSGGGEISAGGPAALRDAREGDTLLFFNPRLGRVLGHAKVRSVAEGGKYTLSNVIGDIDTWEPGDGRGSTMVYSTRVAARFFVRDSRFMDSMRVGIYVKAAGGAIFNNTIDGVAGAGVNVANEPEWPEGPPATHLWIQGNTFSQNNYGYMARNRAHLSLDPAEITINTRRLRDPDGPSDYRGLVTSGQYANSHMKIIGNVFHDWRGMGVAVRNSRNVLIADNVFLPPADDEVMRKTLSRDDALNQNGRGAYAAIFLDSDSGVRVAGNRFYGLQGGDRGVVTGAGVEDLAVTANLDQVLSRDGLETRLSFSEWFGNSAENTGAAGERNAHAELRGVQHRAGRIGGGLYLDGRQSRAAVPTRELGAAFSLALWLRAEAGAGSSQVLYTQGTETGGLTLAVEKNRLVAGVWQDGEQTWLDLGPAVAGQWQHVALLYDGSAGLLRGIVDGLELASATRGVPAKLKISPGYGLFGGALTGTRIGAQPALKEGAAPFRGQLDEFHYYTRALEPAEVSALALR